MNTFNAAFNELVNKGYMLGGASDIPNSGKHMFSVVTASEFDAIDLFDVFETYGLRVRNFRIRPGDSGGFIINVTVSE